MALKLVHGVCPSPPPLFRSLSILSNSRNPFFTHLLFHPPPKTLITLSHSQNPIFLPLLDQEEEEEEEEEEELEGEEPENQVEEEIETDPLLQFFKSLSKTPDPKRKGRLLLQDNRRTAWRLAPTQSSETHNDSISQEPGLSSAFDLGSGDDGSRQEEEEEREGVIEEILRIARNLPQNSTLGEFLDPFVGRIGEVECVSVLALLGEEGLFSSCLYFYEWMRLQEPSLLTPRACPVMFSVLGRAGMGDQIMILFDNLPKQLEFRDLRVYNAAISGLSCCGR